MTTVLASAMMSAQIFHMEMLAIDDVIGVKAGMFSVQ